MMKTILILSILAGLGFATIYSSRRWVDAAEKKQLESLKRELFEAAYGKGGGLERFRQLYPRFAKLDPRDSLGNTPFIAACQSGTTEIIRYLLQLHPSTQDISKSPLYNSTNSRGNTAVHEAALAGRAEVVKLLLGSNTLLALAMASVPNVVNLKTALHFAVEYDFELVVEVLLKLHADVNAADIEGKTPIMVACKSGAHSRIVDRLLKANAETYILSHTNRTIMHYAVISNSEQTVALILEKVNAAKAAKSVLQQHRKISSPGKGGKSPTASTLTLSLNPPSHEKDLFNVKDYDGYTAFHYAVEKDGSGSLREILLALKEHGAHFHSRDKLDKRPFEYLKRETYEQVRDVMLDDKLVSVADMASTTIPKQESLLKGDVSLEGCANYLHALSTQTPAHPMPHSRSVVVIVGSRGGSSAELEGRLLGTNGGKGLKPGMLGFEELLIDELFSKPQAFYKKLKRSYLPLRREKLATVMVHQLLDYLEARQWLKHIITLNTDGMEFALHPNQVLELNGSVLHGPLVCSKCRTSISDLDVHSAYWSKVEELAAGVQPDTVVESQPAGLDLKLSIQNGRITCGRIGCVEGALIPNVRMLPQERFTGTVLGLLNQRATREAEDIVMHGCSMIIIVGTSISADMRISNLLDLVPTNVPRLLIDTELSGPFQVESPINSTDLQTILSSGRDDVAAIFPAAKGGIEEAIRVLGNFNSWNFDFAERSSSSAYTSKKVKTN
ncbi:hypothetical protein HDV05_008069 [Chytridiales sp. JEL 0842]|nr:hypothetical protein HDV05_008069 [Chytridiales sp. JEL 0842]